MPSPTPSGSQREKTVPLTPEDNQATMMECDEEMVKCLPRCLIQSFDSRAWQTGAAPLRTDLLRLDCSQSMLKPQPEDEPQRPEGRKGKTRSAIQMEAVSPCECYPMQIFSKRYPYAMDPGLIIRVRPADGDDDELTRLLDKAPAAPAEASPRPKTPAPALERDAAEPKVLVYDPDSGLYQPPVPFAPTPASKSLDVMVNPFADKAKPKTRRLKRGEFPYARYTLVNGKKQPRTLEHRTGPRTFDWSVSDERMEGSAGAARITKSHDGVKERAMLAEHERLEASPPFQPKTSVPDWLQAVKASLAELALETNSTTLMHRRLQLTIDIDKLEDTLRDYGIEHTRSLCDYDEAIDEEYMPYCMKSRLPDVLRGCTRFAIVECISAQRALAEFKHAFASFKAGEMPGKEFMECMAAANRVMARDPSYGMSNGTGASDPLDLPAAKVEMALEQFAMNKAHAMGIAVRDTPIFKSRGMGMEFTRLCEADKNAERYEFYSKDFVTLKQLYLQRLAERQMVEIRLLKVVTKKHCEDIISTPSAARTAVKEILHEPFSSSPQMPVSPSVALPSQGSETGADACMSAEKTFVRPATNFILDQLDDMLDAFDNIGENTSMDELMEAHAELSKEIAEMKEAFAANGVPENEIQLIGMMMEPLDCGFLPSTLAKCDFDQLEGKTLQFLDAAYDANMAYATFMAKHEQFVADKITAASFIFYVEDASRLLTGDTSKHERVTDLKARASLIKDALYSNKVQKEGAFSRAVKLRPSVSFRGYEMTWETFNNVKPGSYALQKNNFAAYTYQDLKLEFLRKSAELQAIETSLALLQPV